LFKSKNCSNIKNVQILKIFRIIRKKKNEKKTKNQKKTVKPEKKKINYSKKTTSTALTGRPSIAPTRAEHRISIGAPQQHINTNVRTSRHTYAADNLKDNPFKKKTER
jgi:hypothetical protein